MYLFLILFFLSLFGIIIMIGRKLMSKKDLQIGGTEESLFEAPNLQEIKQTIIENSKTFGHRTLLVILRIYVISSNFFRQRRLQLTEKMKKVFARFNKKNLNAETPKEGPSKFVKIISEYKHKVRKMTHRIKQEEGIEE